MPTEVSGWPLKSFFEFGNVYRMGGVTADRFGIGRNGLTNSRIRGDGRCC